MNIQWESEKYKNDFAFVHQYGESVLQLIESGEDFERRFAVDVGCGNGELTQKLAEMGFQVLGIDDSEDMLGTAAKLHPELKFQKGNAINFHLQQKADVIFSNAVFHWIDESDQLKMAENLFEQLNDGGQLVCEFGGRGCAEIKADIISETERILRDKLCVDGIWIVDYVRLRIRAVKPLR